jgi:hypothetical protein
MLLNVLSSALANSPTVQTWSALRAAPGAFSHVGQSVYAKTAERAFLPLAVLLAMAPRYIDNDPLPAQPVGFSLPTGHGAEAATAALKQMTADLSKLRQAGKARYLDFTTERWAEIFNNGGVLGTLLPTQSNGQGVVADVEAQLTHACQELAEAQMSNKALRKAFLLQAAEQDAELDDMEGAYQNFVRGHADTRLAAVEQVFGRLVRGEEDPNPSFEKNAMFGSRMTGHSVRTIEPRPTVDATALVFNLATVLGDPVAWPALQTALFERTLQHLGVTPQEVDAMRAAQARYRSGLADVAALLTPSEKD